MTYVGLLLIILAAFQIDRFGQMNASDDPSVRAKTGWVIIVAILLLSAGLRFLWMGITGEFPPAPSPPDLS
jgi:hypothetical protein